MKNNQEYLLETERELKYRNYSVKTIKAYITCIKYFLEKIGEKPEIISRDEIIDFIFFYNQKTRLLRL